MWVPRRYLWGCDAGDLGDTDRGHFGRHRLKLACDGDGGEGDGHCRDGGKIGEIGVDIGKPLGWQRFRRQLPKREPTKMTSATVAVEISEAMEVMALRACANIESGDHGMAQLGRWRPTYLMQAQDAHEDDEHHTIMSGPWSTNLANRCRDSSEAKMRCFDFRRIALLGRMGRTLRVTGRRHSVRQAAKRHAVVRQRLHRS